MLIVTRKKMFEVFEVLYGLAYKAREEGILALEENIPENRCYVKDIYGRSRFKGKLGFFINRLLGMVCDGQLIKDLAPCKIASMYFLPGRKIIYEIAHVMILAIQNSDAVYEISKQVALMLGLPLGSEIMASGEKLYNDISLLYDEKLYLGDDAEDFFSDIKKLDEILKKKQKECQEVALTNLTQAKLMREKNPEFFACKSVRAHLIFYEKADDSLNDLIKVLHDNLGISEGYNCYTCEFPVSGEDEIKVIKTDSGDIEVCDATYDMWKNFFERNPYRLSDLVETYEDDESCFDFDYRVTLFSEER